MTTVETISRKAEFRPSNDHGGNPVSPGEVRIPFTQRRNHRSRKVVGVTRRGGRQRAFMPFAGLSQRIQPLFIPSDEGSKAFNDLKLRLDNANRYFRRMAAAVFNDEEAMELLRSMYTDVLVENEGFDFRQHGRALTRLTAANFCELGPDDIYITEAGQRFIDSLSKS